MPIGAVEGLYLIERVGRVLAKRRKPVSEAVAEHMSNSGWIRGDKGNTMVRLKLWLFALWSADVEGFN